MRVNGVYILHADSSRGVSPPSSLPVYSQENVIQGNQIAYILFPRSDLNIALGCIYNVGYSLKVETEESIRVYVAENTVANKEDNMGFLYCYFDMNFRVREVRPSDAFKVLRNTQVIEGKLPPIKDYSAYMAELRDSVTYWVDGGWVTEAELRAAENQNQ